MTCVRQLAANDPREEPESNTQQGVRLLASVRAQQLRLVNRAPRGPSARCLCGQIARKNEPSAKRQIDSGVCGGNVVVVVVVGARNLCGSTGLSPTRPRWLHGVPPARVCV